MKSNILNTGVAFALAAFTYSAAMAQEVEPPPDPASDLGHLKSVEVPLPDLTGIVKNKEKAIALGKALFWDMQVGSDGQACASCHFKAGADSRIVNQVSPGLLDMPSDTTFDSGLGPNKTLSPSDFPLRKFADEDDRNSTILRETNDVVSSQGTFAGEFIKLINTPDGKGEKCGPADPTVFHNNINGLAARKVEPRNTPTTINAVFQFDSFWDGRAKNAFNGVDPFGLRSIKHDPAARILVKQGDGSAALEEFTIKNSALASQAVGPPLSDFEMSCANKTFKILGKKVLSLKQPLAHQYVDPDDSVLGPYRDAGDGKGLTSRYGKLIRQAFDKKFYSLKGKFTINPDGSLTTGTGFTQIQSNFSLFWGISIMLYEATLVSDNHRFAQFVGCEGETCSEHIPANPYILTEREKNGLSIFMNEGKCINCHKGPDFTGAGVHLQAENEEGGLVERMLMGDEENGPALYDNGFYNIGVTPTKEDIGRGGTDPWGNPLSWTRQFLNSMPPCTVDAGPSESCIDMFEVDACKFEVPIDGNEPPWCDPNNVGDNLDEHRHAVDGAFKTPTLLNVGLTAPYFHNGGQKSLAEVVAFYNRGGDRQGNCDWGEFDNTATKHPNTGVKNCNLDADITELGLTDEQQADLVAFMLTLTDRRVECESAPFDHPSLVVPNGQNEWETEGGRAEDDVIEIPAVGKYGLPKGTCHANTGDLFITSLGKSGK